MSSEQLLLIDTQINARFKVEVLRNLRNMTSYGFSSFNGQIAQQQQQEWWERMQGHIKGWLYWHINDLDWIGFGVLREADGRWWNSIGVQPKYQGHGYGSYITHDLISKHDGPIYSVVVRGNRPAMAMHNAADWEEIEGVDPVRLIYLRSRVPEG